MSAGRLLAAAALVTGCSAAPTPIARTGSPEAPPPSAARGSDLGGPSGDFRSKRFDLVLPLPDGARWRIDDHHGSWLSATHAASSSALLVRAWRDDARMTRDTCEARARASLALPDLAGAEVLEERAVAIPPDFDTHARTAIAAPSPREPLRGFVMAFGGSAHRCFAYVYTTSATGDDATLLVGSRLATMVETSLLRVTTESDLTPRIPRAMASIEARIGEPEALAWYTLVLK